ncbi:MAG: phosphoglycerate kinase [Gammaproteobacteria bacterium]|nr:phosphoglycerate kinase [Gammaproteobacteria bacterium]
MAVNKLADLQLHNKRVLIRADLNVPLDGTKITNDLRIRASLPTIEFALERGAGVFLVSHLGRPKLGSNNDHLSLEPVAERLRTLLNRPVELIRDWQSGLDIDAGEIKLLENIRFHSGETENDRDLSRSLASLCDIYVNDAFGTAHRAHASTHGVANYVTDACAGLLLESEIDALERALANPKRPLVAVLGGSKISGKLEVLHNLKRVADTLLVGGGMANTFLLAAGKNVGKSLVESELIDDAKVIRRSAQLPLPVDVMTSETIDLRSHAFLRLADEIPSHEAIVDIGPETARRYAKTIADAGTVIWNGPMGIFEYPQFAEGTRAVADAIANTVAFTLAGGGDTVAAIEQFDISERIDYISTGGGAFLEFIEGKPLPGVEALKSDA